MKINKKLKTALLFGVPVLIGAYLIYRQLRPKPPVVVKPPVGGGGGGVPTVGWTKFKVITLTDPLNIRESATTSSSILGTLPIGSIIWAKPSSTSGWHEYSADGSTRAGYVSSTYISAV